MQRFSVSPIEIVLSLIRHQGLIKNLIRRDVVGRYKGSFLGIFWSFFNPICLLIVYTFMFSIVFKARWSGHNSGSKSEFALILFAGLMVFNFFAEVVNKSPSLVLSNVSYVKKVVFPLEILSMVSLGAAFFHMAISFFVWIIFYLVIFGVPPITALLLPIIFFPLVLLTMGLSWMLSSLGVFFRDVSQIIGVLTTTLMFLSPIFYPISSLPQEYQAWMLLNPMTTLVEAVRDVLIWGKVPNWSYFFMSSVISGIIAWVGFAWFQLTRKGFADVL